MFGFSKGLIAMALAAFLVVGGGAVGTATYVNQEEVVVKNAVAGFVSDALEREEISSVLDLLDGGSVELDVNSVKTSIGADYLKGMQLSGKAYFAKDAFMLENVSVTGIGKSNLSLEFDAYFDKSTAYVTEEKILGGTYLAYGISGE